MARLPWDTAPLPCCGIGIGWLLDYEMNKFGSIIGGKGWRGADLPTTSSLYLIFVHPWILPWFYPWYVGAIMLLCIKDYDKREKPGFIACAIVAVIATVAIIVAVAILYHN